MCASQLRGKPRGRQSHLSMFIGSDWENPQGRQLDFKGGVNSLPSLPLLNKTLSHVYLIANVWLCVCSGGFTSL